MSLRELLYHVDVFCQHFLPHWDQQLRAHGQRVRHRPGPLALSDLMTIVMYVHHLRFRNFKTSYLASVRGHLHREFPQAVRYQRFVERMPSTVGRCVPTCKSAWVPVVAARSWIQPRERSATIVAFRSIGSFGIWSNGR